MSSFRITNACSLKAVFFAAIISFFCVAQGHAETTMLFGTSHFKGSSSSIERFPKWRDALFRHEKLGFPADALQFLEDARVLSGKEQISAVHRYVEEKFSYRHDFQNYGVGDYWAAPGEAFAKESGDCEDYAIAKYFLLRALGWNDEDLRIVALRSSTSLLSGTHVATVVFFDGDAWMLDNLNPEKVINVALIRDLYDSHALYSFNESGWWLLGG